MELKTSISKQHYDANAKDYVINMMNGRRKLHKKNGCKDSKCLNKYYDFDTYAQAKESGIEHTECGNCADLENDRREYQNKEKSIITLQNSLLSKRKTLTTVGAITFFLIAFILTAIIAMASWGGDMGTIIGPVMLLLLVIIPLIYIFIKMLKAYNETKKELLLLSKGNDKTFQFLITERKQSAKKSVTIIWIVLIVIMLMIASITGGGSSNKNRYDDVFNKDPNTWTDDEEEYVNDLFDWMK